jgi:hypothetical protein
MPLNDGTIYLIKLDRWALRKNNDKRGRARKAKCQFSRNCLYRVDGFTLLFGIEQTTMAYVSKIDFIFKIT